MRENIPRLMLAGTGSGCGKTTVTCAVLGALMRRGRRVASFKCGPDYIDPMFHSEILGARARNLDLYLCGERAVRYLLARGGSGMDCALIEGVMGLYDGLGAASAEISSWDLSRRTDTPVVLVVDCAGKSLSLAAEVRGFLDFHPNGIKGVIVNGASEAMFPVYQRLLEEHAGVKALGYLPRLPEASIESRHLGLVTAAEIGDLSRKTALLAQAAERCMDLDGLLALADSAPPLSYEDLSVKRRGDCRIAVAQDRAFCFYYQDALDLLRDLGAELVSFSPISDRALPECDALLLGGGYPELYLEALSGNTSMRESVRAACEGGLPVLAECGGFMYLQQAIEDGQGVSRPMAGVLPGVARLGKRLTRFGYAEVTAREDNLLCRAGESMRVHEFHYSDSSCNGEVFHAKKPSGREWDCIQARGRILAGYPHFHLWGNVEAAVRFFDSIAKR